MSKKGLLFLGDITPWTKSNLFETFVFYRYYNSFIKKSAKNLLNMPTCLVILAYYVKKTFIAQAEQIHTSASNT